MYTSQVFQLPKNRVNIINNSSHKDTFLQFLKIETHKDINKAALAISHNNTCTPTIPLFIIIIAFKILCQDRIT